MIVVITPSSTYNFTFENLQIDIPKSFLTDVIKCIVLTEYDAELFGYKDGCGISNDIASLRSKILYEFYECESNLYFVRNTYVVHGEVTFLLKIEKNNEEILFEEFKAQSQTEAVFKASQKYYSYKKFEELEMSVYVVNTESNLKLRCIFDNSTAE